MTYFAVRVADKPADAEHHYGHGKIESISALAETALLLFVLSGVVMWEAGLRLFASHGAPVEATAVAFVIILVSIAVNLYRARVLGRVAAATSSQALAADALHFSSDMWSSAAVLLGLVGVRFGYGWADAAAAMVVALFVCLAGWRLGGAPSIRSSTPHRRASPSASGRLSAPCAMWCRSIGCAPRSAPRCSARSTSR